MQLSKHRVYGFTLQITHFFRQNRYMVIAGMLFAALLIVRSCTIQIGRMITESITIQVVPKSSDIKASPATIPVSVEIEKPVETIKSMLPDSDKKKRDFVGWENVASEDKYATQRQYINRFSKIAVVEQDKFGIPASIKLAQGILESGSGKSNMAIEINNHFGIKCHVRGCKNGHCKHYHDDSPTDRFKLYTSAWESWRDHSIKLNGDRYKPLHNKTAYTWGAVKPDKTKPDDAEKWNQAVKNWKTPYKRWAYGLDALGYATGKDYANKLIQIIERHQLQKFDNIK